MCGGLSINKLLNLKQFDDNYANKLLFEDMEESLALHNLIQVVKFETWSNERLFL